MYQRRKLQKDPDLSDFSLTTDLQNEILRLYKKGGFETHKGERQKKIILACAIIAMINYGEIPIRSHLIRLLGIDAKKYNGCTSYLGQLRQFSINPVKIYTPVELTVPFLASVETDQLETEQRKRDIIEFWNKIIAQEHFQRIQDEEPTLVTCWLLSELKIAKASLICEFYGITEVKLRDLINRSRRWS